MRALWRQIGMSMSPLSSCFNSQRVLEVPTLNYDVGNIQFLT